MAFDSKDYERVLFVAHREEILQQAAVSFQNVRNSDDYGYFNGDQKCTDKSVIFASVATLGRQEYLNEIPKLVDIIQDLRDGFDGASHQVADTHMVEEERVLV